MSGLVASLPVSLGLVLHIPEEISASDGCFVLVRTSPYHPIASQTPLLEGTGHTTDKIEVFTRYILAKNNNIEILISNGAFLS